MIIGLSGYARSGKDTVGEYLVKAHGFTRLAFADALKEVAYTLNPIVGAPSGTRLQEIVNEWGWDKAKETEEIRRILQVLGTECGRDILGPLIWTNVIRDRIYDSNDEDFVVTDCRFPNEVSLVRDGYQGSLWWVSREEVVPLNSHPSENLVSIADANRVISNNGTLEELYDSVDKILVKTLLDRQRRLLH